MHACDASSKKRARETKIILKAWWKSCFSNIRNSHASNVRADEFLSEEKHQLRNRFPLYLILP